MDWHPCDVGDGTQVFEVIRAVRPDRVYHLAGAGGACAPAELIRTNVQRTWNLLDACRKADVERTSVLVVGSAASSGEMDNSETGLGEERPARPVTFYGCSRQAALDFGRAAWLEWGLRVFLCRPFNLVGPGLPEKYAAAALVRRLRDEPRSFRFAKVSPI